MSENAEVLARTVDDLLRRIKALERGGQLSRSSVEVGGSTIGVVDGIVAGLAAEISANQAIVDAASAVASAGSAEASAAAAAALATAASAAANNITSTQITTDAVTAPKIAANAVIAGKINADAVTAREVAADAILARNIKAGEVVAGKLSANSVVSSNIAADQILASHIKAGEIVAGKLAADSVVSANIAAGAVTATELSATAVNGKTITGATVQTAASGARVVQDTAGLRLLNAAGTAVVNLATATGTASLTGELITGIVNSTRTVTTQTIPAALLTKFPAAKSATLYYMADASFWALVQNAASGLNNFNIAYVRGTSVINYISFNYNTNSGISSLVIDPDDVVSVSTGSIITNPNDGYYSTLTGQTITSAPVVLIQTPFTVPAGRYKISFNCYSLSGVAGEVFDLEIQANGVAVGTSRMTAPGPYGNGVYFSVPHTTGGTTTYRVLARRSVGSNNGAANTSALSPMSILVEEF